MSKLTNVNKQCLGFSHACFWYIHWQLIQIFFNDTKLQLPNQRDRFVYSLFVNVYPDNALYSFVATGYFLVGKKTISPDYYNTIIIISQYFLVIRSSICKIQVYYKCCAGSEWLYTTYDQTNKKSLCGETSNDVTYGNMSEVQASRVTVFLSRTYSSASIWFSNPCQSDPEFCPFVTCAFRFKIDFYKHVIQE